MISWKRLKKRKYDNVAVTICNWPATVYVRVRNLQTGNKFIKGRQDVKLPILGLFVF